ncbi:Con-6 family protein [Hymenobacter sp. H14-R3]|uniref:Con-6 family protein n=1 Tax=Hymenobacter sp. H14-R3 TaxID=3046308 RepID=UPI0024BB4540|nr:Con-6 family protein [Hymenobacter sp. H14-R3]MDJ0367914.1 Con-6 family protein [Hymenobacter sp. H14-R3]
MRPTSVILQDIKKFQPTADGNWFTLHELVQELWTEDEGPAEALVPLFRLLERFPEDESAGVLWGVLHGIESYPNYETELVQSLQRHPTDLTVTMVHRMANSGYTLVAGHAMKSLYQAVLAHPRASEEAKERAQDYLADK